jgi:hypothetical protein
MTIDLIGRQALGISLGRLHDFSRLLRCLAGIGTAVSAAYRLWRALRPIRSTKSMFNAPIGNQYAWRSYTVSELETAFLMIKSEALSAIMITAALR